MGQFKTTVDLFQKQLHAYTISHAIEDANVLRFHVDYFKREGKGTPKPGESLAKRAIVDAILAKHDTATGARRFNALFATASINDAIEYHALFKTLQAEKQAADGAQGHPRRLQRAFWLQPHGERVRSLLSGCAKAHQRPAMAQC